MPSPRTTQRHGKSGLTLIECMIAVVVTALLFLATLAALMFGRVNHELEQERTRATQIVSEMLEIERLSLFTFTSSESQQILWDRGTVDDPSDDTVGSMELEVRDIASGDLITTVTTNQMVLLEATLSWTPRGSRLSGKTMRETVMTYKVPY